MNLENIFLNKIKAERNVVYEIGISTDENE